jgi:hypothetical protein
MKILTNLLLFTLVILLQSCEKDTREEVDYIARIDDNYLTESEIDRELDSLRAFGKFREEFIIEWVNRELLYNLAIEKGILESREYNEVMKLSGKELAISFLLDMKSNSIIKKVSDEELRNYYDISAEFSTLQNDMYIINHISFNDPYAAERFRKNLIDADTNWTSAINEFDSSAISAYVLKDQFFKNQLEPKYVARRLRMMTEKEVSSVFEKEPKVFSIVQLIDSFQKGSRLPFEYLKVDIAKLYIAFKQKEMLDALLDSLYKEYEIEIKSE